ncbi:MAG: cytochrome c biogenesis protein CcsA [Bacteroidetes bacterium]|nr:cytochrome c biogenesis protein CcsA [Bacteroidota bacterium]
MLGRILIYAAFGGMLTAAFAYMYSFFSGDTKPIKIARAAYHVGAVSVILTAGYMMNLLLTHQFQYTYVWSYSSYELHPPLLISTFYVGQEGSFMLWTLYTSIIGLILMVYSRKHHYESSIMGVFSAIATFLVLIFVIKNPFEHVWQTWPSTVKAGFMPDNGRGLNPLLENFWIVIHPPILFLGFASTAVPFAHAISGLLRKDYRKWINVAVPWTLFTSAVLGFGITLGGFWAYETLGWGGFWGWDPVENSSFIPWLLAVASVHTLLVQRRTGGFKRANLIMGMLPFLLVLYSTFLTRSGVLGDTSVHSFETPGMWVYVFLVALIAFFAAIGFGLYFFRVRDIPKQKISYTLTSREFALFLGAASLVIVAGFTLIGTSAPLITGILEGKPSAINASYYIKTNLPLAIVMAAMIGLGQLFWWKKSNSQTLLKTMRFPLTAAAVLTAIVSFAGMHDISMILFFLASSFALFVNLEIAYKIAKGKPAFMGASLAHIGIALLFIGIIASTHYDKHVTLSLSPNEPQTAFGYKLTYTGTTQLDHGQTAYNVMVQSGSSRFNAPLVMYASQYNGGAMMRHPYIFSLINYDIFSHPALLAFIGKNMLTRDLYLSPQGLEQVGESALQATQYGISIPLKLNEPVKVGRYTYTFTGFQVPESERKAMMDGRPFHLNSIIKITNDAGKIQTIMPTDEIEPNGNTKLQSVTTKAGDKFTVLDVHVNDQTKMAAITMGYLPADNSPDISLLKQAAEQAQDTKQGLVIEATIKPFINLVWGGVLVMVIGFIVTWRRRRAELMQEQAQPVSQ